MPTQTTSPETPGPWLDYIQTLKQLKQELGISGSFDVPDSQTIRVTPQQRDTLKKDLQAENDAVKRHEIVQAFLKTEKGVILQEGRQEHGTMQREIDEQYRKQLEALRESLQRGIIPDELMQEMLENLPKNPVRRGILLGSMLSYIGEMRKFSIAFQNGRFELIGTRGHVQREKVFFEELLNGCIQKGNITAEDVSRAFLYRTYEELEKYEKEAGEQATQAGFVRSLLSKNTHLKALLPEENTELASMVDTEEKYENLLSKIRANVQNQTHQEFLVSYFTRLKTSPDTQEISLSEYTTQVNELEKEIISRMQQFNQVCTENGQQPVDLVPSMYRDAARHPTKAMTDQKLIRGMVGLGFLGIMGALIGSFFKNKEGKGKGLLGGLLGVIAGLFLLGGGKGMGRWLSEMMKPATPALPTLPGNRNERGNRGPAERVPNPGFQPSFEFASNPEEKARYEALWGELAQNERFLGASAKDTLEVFIRPGMTFETQKQFLASFGITLTQDNQEIYRKLFEEILKQRNAVIGEPRAGETIGEYLKRRSEGVESVEVMQDSGWHYRIVSGRTMLYGAQKDPIVISRYEDPRNPEFRREMLRVEPIFLLREAFILWQDKAMRKMTDANQNTKNNLNIKIEEINTEITKLAMDHSLESGIDLNQRMNVIWSQIQGVEQTFEVVGMRKINELKGICSGPGTKEAKMLRMYNIFRDNGADNTKDRLADYLLNHSEYQSDFGNINTLINAKGFDDAVKTKNVNTLKNYLKCSESLAKDIIAQYTEMRTIFSESPEIDKTYAEIEKNPEIASEMGIHNKGDLIEIASIDGVKQFTRHGLLREIIEKKEKRGDKDTTAIGMYANMTGLAENRGLRDYVVMSDSTAGPMTEFLITLGVSAVLIPFTGGVSSAGIVGAFGRLGLTGWRASRMIGILQKIARIRSLQAIGRTAGGAVRMGASVHIAESIAGSWVYGDSFWSNMTDVNQFGKNVAMMGVMRGISSVLKISPLGIKPSDPVSRQAMKGFSQIVAQAGGMTALNDYVFEDEGTWNWEHFMQALVLATTLGGVSKIRFRKGQGGNVTAHPQKPPVAPISVPGSPGFISRLSSSAKQVVQGLSTGAASKLWTMLKFLTGQQGGKFMNRVGASMGGSLGTGALFAMNAWKDGDIDRVINEFAKGAGIGFVGGFLAGGTYILFNAAGIASIHYGGAPQQLTKQVIGGISGGSDLVGWQPNIGQTRTEILP